MIGMIAAGRISANRALWSEADLELQNSLIARAGITRGIEGIDPDIVYEAMKHDKKVVEGKIRFILADAIGSVNIYDDVTESEAKDAISYVLQ